jgi:hypothetical protein
VNVVRQGRTRLVLWSDTTSHANAGVKYASHHFYTMLGGGSLPRTDTAAMSVAAGGELDLGPVEIAFDGMYTLTSRFEAGHADDMNYGRVRGMAGLRLARWISLLVGGGPEIVERVRGEIRFRGYGVLGAEIL